MCKIDNTGIWVWIETMRHYGHHNTKVCSTCKEEDDGHHLPRLSLSTFLPESAGVPCTASWRVLQLCNYILPLKIMLHLSNWIRLHFIMLILDTFSSHFKGLNNRHPSQLWVYEEEQLSGIRSSLWWHLPAIRLRYSTTVLSVHFRLWSQT